MCGHENVLQWVLVDLVFALTSLGAFVALSARDTKPFTWLAFASVVFALALFLAVSTIVAQHRLDEAVQLASEQSPLLFRC